MNVLRLRSFDKHVIVQSILVCARMDKVYHHLRRLHRAISILFPFMPLKIANSNDNRPSIYNQCRIESFIMSHYLWLMVYDSWFMTCLKSIEQFLWSKKWPREYSDQWSKTQSTTKNDHWVLHRFSCITIKESDNSRNNQNNLENTFSSVLTMKINIIPSGHICI